MYIPWNHVILHGISWNFDLPYIKTIKQWNSRTQGRPFLREYINENLQLIIQDRQLQDNIHVHVNFDKINFVVLKNNILAMHTCIHCLWLSLSLTCASMLQHCCNRDTGGLPMLVASCTRNSCSFCVPLSWMACSIATAANQLDKESALNKPPQSNCPAVIWFAKEIL